jgi:hypothetical protein
MIIFKENRLPRIQEGSTPVSKANILNVLNQTNMNAMYIFTSPSQSRPAIEIISPKRFTSSATKGLTFKSKDGLVQIHFDEKEFEHTGTVLNENGFLEYTLYLSNKEDRIVVVA